MCAVVDLGFSKGGFRYIIVREARAKNFVAMPIFDRFGE